MKTGYWTIGFVLVILLCACGKRTEGIPPPEILFGLDTCAQCGMIISEPRFAAGTILATGETRIFDDIGEMLVFHMEKLTDQAVAWFVHDYPSEEWIRGESAYYVTESDIVTPMGFAIAAFATKEAAEAFIAEHSGMIYTLDDLRIKVHEEVHGD